MVCVCVCLVQHVQNLFTSLPIIFNFEMHRLSCMLWGLGDCGIVLFLVQVSCSSKQINKMLLTI